MTTLHAPLTTHLLIRAARGERVERPPVWAMRQAGRWDPEFNKLRAGLSFYEFSEHVELAAKASLCPKRFGVDAIILFYDITTLTVAMGLPFVLQPNVGPVPDRPVHTKADLERLDANPDPARYQHIRDLLKLVKAELRGELPVIVFAGAPFTLATYCIGTGKNLAATREFIAERGEVWRGLLERIATATAGFLNTLIADGAELYQLFDSWAGELTAQEYEAWAQPYHRSIFREAPGAPRILFVKECPHLVLMTQSGADVVSLGASHDLATCRERYPYLVFQGNVDEEILRTGTPEQVRETTRRCVLAGGGLRHIVNLNHGVDRATPVVNFETYVRAAKSLE
ncbi:MAG TPA: uroporphyrinogen decarboxylase family protein [Gemmataceae bacterium]|nr:uroporphyrinogen decarboxylase family protein [Gemmataceae bacterium]